MEENELLQRAKEEREQIFERYEIGRQNGNIAPWEEQEKEWDIYRRVDRYGFIQIEQKSNDESNNVNNNNNPERDLEISLIREKKWLTMLKYWDKSNTQEKIKRRIYKGIPNKFRLDAWTHLLRINEKIQQNNGVYMEMLKLAREYSTETRQIDFDVNRQFREHINYYERYSPKQKSLFNVLIAYSVYNMELGYCQGMAAVVGILLMYMDEEQAFWALSTFMCDRKYAMHGLFIEGFPKLQRFLSHHDKILAKFLPKLHKHLTKHGLDSILYAIKWFFVLFVERIPFNLCLRIWDIYMIEGERVVTAMAFTILRIHRDKLLKMKDMDEMTEFLQSRLHKNFLYDDDYVIKALRHSMTELRRYNMDLPPPPMDNELPKYEFGTFIEPDVDRIIGHRKSGFTSNEKRTTKNIIQRQEEIIQSDQVSNYSYDNTYAGSIKTFRSMNSLATSMATSIQTVNSDTSDKSTEVTHL